MQRRSNRAHDCVRPLKITYDVFPYADGSVMFEMGNTKILVAITLQASVPPFLRGKKTGWLNAEYALLPAATHIRGTRESNAASRQGRSIEISRFIGRVLRSVCNLNILGERTIIVDCDVFQADGSTRAASINGAYLALRAAEHKWMKDGIIKVPCLREPLAAVSVGISSSGVLLDVDYEEDTVVDADLTFVLTATHKLIELQGTAERTPCSWESYQQAYGIACHGITHILNFLHTHDRAEHGYYREEVKRSSSLPLATP